MDLTTLEEIRSLKYRYLRCVDLKRWDELAEVFTADAVANYGTRAVGEPIALTGRDEILGYLRENLGPEITTVHFAGHPEITVDGDTASGRWCFEDTVIAAEYRMLIRGAAYYEDTYRRCTDGAWRIASTGYERIYEYMHSLDDLPSLRFTTTRWTAPAAT
ncbi:nuclear transport factor 2 family protein [Haloechinothrix sp. LS1_15]|uniref:nuclear transport factor 2 family protein n=1 Tax=Haloechinothrix sp. LS1_15 TaxID=2652248 RepID=UPI002946FA2B|nr:nuclear transport factor 2 family protein [Haloechinothrix sp. LS1_15]MDV6011681.1 nuclear transport factor 2 family protein [Haloechinothrix sp. LS1_15]